MSISTSELIYKSAISESFPLSRSYFEFKFWKSYIYDPSTELIYVSAPRHSHYDMVEELYGVQIGGQHKVINKLIEQRNIIQFGTMPQYRDDMYFAVRDRSSDSIITEILERSTNAKGAGVIQISYLDGSKFKMFTFDDFRETFKIPRNPKMKRNAPDFIEDLGKKQRGKVKGTEVDFYRNGIEERLLSAFEGGVSAIAWNKKIACGAYGCAFPTDIEEIILKITSDKTEAAGAQALLSTGRWWNGLLGIHAVYSIPKYNIFALFTERVGSIRSKEWFEQPDGIPRNFNQMLFGEANEIMVEPLYAMQQSILGMYPNVPDAYLDRWIDELLDLAGTLPQITNLADDYFKLWENFRIVFPDVHAGNLGYRIFDGAGVEPTCTEWVTDEGDVSGRGRFTAPSVLCLDLGIASGSGLAGSQVMRLNPPHYLKGWLEMIPRL